MKDPTYMIICFPIPSRHWDKFVKLFKLPFLVGYLFKKCILIALRPSLKVEYCLEWIPAWNAAFFGLLLIAVGPYLFAFHTHVNVLHYMHSLEFDERLYFN